jgi:hypothetical protein
LIGADNRVDLQQVAADRPAEDRAQQLKHPIGPVGHPASLRAPLPRVRLCGDLIKQADDVALGDLDRPHRSDLRQDVPVKHRLIVAHGAAALVGLPMPGQPLAGDLRERRASPAFLLARGGIGAGVLVFNLPLECPRFRPSLLQRHVRI